MAASSGARRGRVSCWLLAGLCGCGTSGDSPPTPRDPPRPLIRLTLERTPCFGFCPEYEVQANADGTAAFRGLRRWKGIERSWQIDPDSFRSLAAELSRVGFFALRDITPDTPACGDVATDHPSIVLTASDGTREHRVSYYLGCRGLDSFPAMLASIANRLDSVTGAARLVDSLQKARPGPH